MIPMGCTFRIKAFEIRLTHLLISSPSDHFMVLMASRTSLTISPLSSSWFWLWSVGEQRSWIVTNTPRSLSSCPTIFSLALSLLILYPEMIQIFPLQVIRIYIFQNPKYVLSNFWIAIFRHPSCLPLLNHPKLWYQLLRNKAQSNYESNKNTQELVAQFVSMRLHLGTLLSQRSSTRDLSDEDIMYITITTNETIYKKGKNPRILILIV